VRLFTNAIAFGIEGPARVIDEMLERLRSGEARGAMFVAPGATGWLLPLHELALMTARDLARNDVERVELRLLNPEDRRLALFGDQGSESTARLLAAAGDRVHRLERHDAPTGACGLHRDAAAPARPRARRRTEHGTE
jgi:hypothetical protein